MFDCLLVALTSALALWSLLLATTKLDFVLFPSLTVTNNEALELLLSLLVTTKLAFNRA